MLYWLKLSEQTILHLKGVCSIEVQKNGTNLALLIDVLNHTSNLNTIRNSGSAQQLTFTLDLDVNYGSLPEV